MGSILLAAAASFGLVTVIAAVSARLTHRWWRGVPELGFGFAVIGVGLTCWVQFLAAWIAPGFGSVVAIVLGVGFVVAFIAFRLWRWLAPSLTPLLLAAGLLMAYLGLTYLWGTGGIDGFSLAALRFSYHDEPYPIDNLLPTLMANRIHEGGSTHGLLLAWNGSDRPPLQSGGLLLAGELLRGVGGQWWDLPMATGVVLQMLWVPALWALIRFAGVDRPTSALAVVFTGSTATMLINSTYTWPKLMSAALVIVSLMLLLAAARGRLGGTVAVGAAALGVTLALLAHGAALFALPAVLVLAFLALRRAGRMLRTALVAAVIVIGTYAPWIYYQRVVDPPGDRLLKWHLAGETGITDRSVIDEILHAYGSITFSEWVDARIGNLGTILSPSIFSGLREFGEEAIGARRYHEYYETSAALGISAILVVAVIVACLVAVARRRPLPDVTLLGLMCLMVPCIGFWWLVMFQPGGTVVHQGSHVWLVLLIALPFAWVVRRFRPAGVPLVAAQAVLTAWFYVPYFGHPQLHPAAVAVAVLGVATVIVGIVVAARSRRSATLAPAVKTTAVSEVG